MRRLPLLAVLGSLALPAGLAGACSATNDTHGAGAAGATGSGGGAFDGGHDAGGTTGSGGTGGDIVGFDGPTCSHACSADLRAVLDCFGQVVQQCTGTDSCDTATATCANACQNALDNQLPVGCEYYATDMDMEKPGLCFAAFVANTWDTAAHIQVDFDGASVNVGMIAVIPSGAGPAIVYGPYDPTAGLPPGEVAILFLAGAATSTVPCPLQPATALGGQILQASGISQSFHITTDVPVVAYQINPYGGGLAAVTGASLLLPTSVWGQNYIAVAAKPHDTYSPSMNIVATEDQTRVVILPKVAISAGLMLPAGPANVPYTFTLDHGQQAQFTQVADLTGSVIQSTKPIGFMAGQPCMQEPAGVLWCDHAEQMVPPVKALGSEYVGVMFRPRVPGDMAIWHMVGVVDGTALTYSSPVGGPATLDAGQQVDFITDQPFVVQSQDMGHAFMLFTLMSGSEWPQLSDTSGYGDPDFVLSVPPQQYLRDYVFFTDPTYPETNLVVVRAPNASMGFDDVTLDCAGALTGWQPVGSYQWTRIDLIRHDFVNQGNCSTGAHEMKSASPFGLWVWGWGSPETTIPTVNVSYGYPGGMNVQPINQLVILPTPQM